MKTTRFAATAIASVSLTAIMVATASISGAANPTTAGFGARQQLVDPGGTAVAAWTIGDLVPSGDAIPYIPAGKLYEANAVIEADQGPATPVVANFNARTSDGGSYRALATVPAAQA